MLERPSRLTPRSASPFALLSVLALLTLPDSATRHGMWRILRKYLKDVNLGTPFGGRVLDEGGG